MKKAPYLKMYDGSIPDIGQKVFFFSFGDGRIREVIAGEQNNTPFYGEYFSTHEQAEEYIDKCFGKECFVFDGEIFKGNLLITRAHYQNQSPSKPWRIWLIDNGLLIGSLS